MELLFWIPIVSGIPDSKTQDSGFNKQNFTGLDIPDSGFRNPESLTSGRIISLNKENLSLFLLFLMTYIYIEEF